ncbi:mai-2, partial [Pristionchus pacificus]
CYYQSGGSGGSIREAGGAFGKLEAAREDEYFYNLQKTQLKGLKDQIQKEIEHHEGQMRNHQEVVERHKKRISELESEEVKAKF